jgi:hypothetical protein
VLRKGLSRAAYVSGLIVCSLALTVAVVESASADFIPGEQLEFTAKEGEFLPATVYVNLGVSTGTGQFFDISNLLIYTSENRCITCGGITENLNNLFFDSGDRYLSGQVTG